MRASIETTASKENRFTHRSKRYPSFSSRTLATGYSRGSSGSGLAKSRIAEIASRSARVTRDIACPYVTWRIRRPQPRLAPGQTLWFAGSPWQHRRGTTQVVHVPSVTGESIMANNSPEKVFRIGLVNASVFKNVIEPKEGSSGQKRTVRSVNPSYSPGA